ncbi:hypothetical protein M422DRAFT_48595 [Sphaerobolus stellatus SS14]|uniref:Fungal calcium binding protein domain-containing protein n=1 Tax=Sphaerobolus stellatus (strain SS14) TaxID=990650 RepID=A0A0C9VTP5_SPHS4|nr:hypothetical protein M422DRAFT_48595 [Sphaerobolus stellatus SS14]
MVSLKLSALFVGLLAVVQASVPSKRQVCILSQCVTALSDAIADTSTEAAADFEDCVSNLPIKNTVGVTTCFASTLASFPGLPDLCVDGDLPAACMNCGLSQNDICVF